MVHPTVILDPQFQIIAANQAMLRVAGMEEPALIGKKCFEVFHGNGRACPPGGCPMETLLTSGQGAITDMEMEAFNRLFLVSCTPMLDEFGNLQKVLHIATDITERKRAQEALRDREKLLQTVTMSARDAIIMMDDQGAITFWNPAAEHIFGWKEAEVLGRDLHLFLAPAAAREDFLRELPRFRLGGEGKALGKILEFRALRRDHTEIPVELSLAAVRCQDRWYAVGRYPRCQRAKAGGGGVAEKTRRDTAISWTPLTKASGCLTGISGSRLPITAWGNARLAGGRTDWATFGNSDLRGGFGR